MPHLGAMPGTTHSPAPSRGARTLAIDLGGSQIKSALVDRAGRPIGEVTRIETPRPLDPPSLADCLTGVVDSHERCDRITIGVNGLVHEGVIYAIPMTDDVSFRRFDLAGELRSRTGKPVRLLNDAELHGLGAIRGRGVELAITLGTGLGTALYIDGRLAPQIHFVPSPACRTERRGGDYGDATIRALGRKRWRARVAQLIVALRRLTNFERLYIGGGNAKYLQLDLPPDITIVDYSVALVGGARAWTWRIQP